MGVFLIVFSKEVEEEEEVEKKIMLRENCF